MSNHNTVICSFCNQKISARSSPQNRYLHYVIGILADEIGYSHLAMKNLLKKEFGYYSEEINKKTKEIIPIYCSTANLNKREFAEFTEKIINLANSNGIRLYSPQEYFLKFKK